MNKVSIHKYLDNEGTITLSASGVTFPCVNQANLHRQQVIEQMKDAENVTLRIVPEPSNPYDEYALRIDWNEYDVGYIPKNADVEMMKNNGRPRRLYSKNINKILAEYPSELTVTLNSVYGGYNGKHYGFSVNISKID